VPHHNFWQVHRQNVVVVLSVRSCKSAHRCLLSVCLAHMSKRISIFFGRTTTTTHHYPPHRPLWMRVCLDEGSSKRGVIQRGQGHSRAVK
jgi:hypothetical protein